VPLPQIRNCINECALRNESLSAQQARLELEAEPLLGSQRLCRVEPLQRHFRLAAINVKHRIEKQGF
jgi:hypothetical protein